MSIGARLTDQGATFSLWAPCAERVEVCCRNDAGQWTEALAPQTEGYWGHAIPGLTAGTRYMYRLDGGPWRPDPASHFQPEGVHGPSALVDHGFDWRDKVWRGVPMEEMIIYELHTGTFTPEGSFDAVIPRLDDLRELGVNAIELMPVAQFPGRRNWGYDGVDLFAVQNSYGGPQGLKRLVDACHHRGLAVLLDVVYNHLGPEGNYLREFGPYFTDRYRTPWGDALNFDGPGSDQVRRFFIENALYWSRCYHIDALRLDAIHAIVDSSACPFLEELAAAARRHAEQQGRPFHLIAETDRNDPTPVRSPEAGGYGMSAQWSDDFHHSVHALLTGERSGYYADFGPLDRLHKALERTYVLDGCHSVFRRRRHGRPCPDQPPRRFVVAIQNHDQVGNRLRGARLNTLLSFEARKLAAGLLLLAPFVPLLFMGEEYGEPHPFRYFTSHGDPELIRAVGEGRKAEFASFGWGEEPPDPQDEATFLQSRLQWELRNEGRHGTLRRYYRRLITLRKGPLHCTDRREQLVSSDSAAGLLTVRLRNDHGEVFCLYNCSTSSHSAAVGTPGAGRRWTRLLESSAGIWDGPGGSAPETIGNADALRFRMPATSLVVYHKDCEVNR